MASRERLASGRATDTARRPAASPAPRLETAPAPALVPPLPWEEIYRNAPPALKQELLALAHRQGVLYVHQLPRERNGHPAENTVAPTVFTSLLAGQVEGWEPVRADPTTVGDPTLDVAQREAVAKALATPDICLIRGLPGTGKSRVVAALVAQAAARGERVLLLAQSAAAIDQVLTLIPARDDLLALRCLGPDERLETLPPASRGWTLAERLRHVSTAALQAARQALSDREHRGQQLRKDEGTWENLEEIADRLAQIQDQVNALAERRPQVAADVEREAAAVTDEIAAGSPFQNDLMHLRRQCRETQTAIDQSLADVRQQVEDQQQQQASLESQIETIRPLAEARQGKRWWTRAWWQAFFRKELLANLAALDEQRQQILDTLAELDQEVQRLTSEREQAAAMLHEQIQQHQQAEITRRQAELDNQVAGFDQEATLLRAKWQAACRTLDPAGPVPASPSLEVVREGRSAWRQQLQQAEQERDFTRRWIACLEEAPPWAGLLPGSANLVAATLTGLAGDPHFGNGAAGRGFDLLVLQEAEGITEADFRAIAGRARRWVLVGEPTFDVVANVQRSYALHKPRPTTLRAGFFDKLWQHLHWEPRGLPYAWVREGERLCCRLRSVPADQRQCLESESLADSPEIELRIFAPPHSQPVLAEVVFPATFSVAEAKAYLYHELEELTVQTSSRSVRWVEEPHRLLFCLAEEPIPNAQTVDLEAGVREHVAMVRSGFAESAGEGTWQTCCLEFDRQAGWERSRAEEWVQRRLGARDLGRTARLDVPHRMQPELALFLSHLLFAGEYRLPAGESAGSASSVNRCPCRVEFVAVPPLRERGDSTPGRGTPSAGPRAAVNLSRKGGAGLEVDLSDPRHRSRLPADLGVDLPAQGFVNYTEAQAAIRVLEDLAERSDDWRTGSAERPTVGVIALYAAQVSLLRALVQRSAKLTAAHFAVTVDLPAVFRERECAVVLLSLTRSHSHRPVTYGEGPELLTLALTRARTQLILLGDAGCLARRSQWQGPLDHLDDLTAARERELVAHLVHYLEGQGGYPHAFHLHEGPGP